MTLDPQELKTEIKKKRNTNSLGFWRESWYQVRLIGRLMRDRNVSIFLKLIPVATVAYLFMPLDLLPDALLGLGQLDDLTVLLLGSRIFTGLVPKHIVEAHREELLLADGLPNSKELDETIIIDQDS